MDIVKLNMAFLDAFAEDDGDLWLARPVGSQLYRCCGIPAKYKGTPFYKEITEVLNTLCTRFHAGVYYFKLDDEALMDLLETFGHMGVDAYSATYLQDIGMDRGGFPILEVLN